MNLVHMESILPPGIPLLIKVLKKGGSWQGRGQSVIGGFGDSFLQVIDSETGARMSGHDWMDLIS